jgi:tRNA-splicing endonuclease subunit Sen34
MANATVSEPFPIFSVGGRYMLYDVDTVMYTRRQHHICGVLIGNLPSANQQNVFSGMPLELMPEEARLLVEKEHAYVVDDADMHHQGLQTLSLEERQRFRRHLEDEGLGVSRMAQRKSDESKARGLAKLSKQKAKVAKESKQFKSGEKSTAHTDEILFESPSRTSPSPAPSQQSQKELVPYLVTPTTSYPPLPTIPSDLPLPLPSAPSSYPLFAHLHERGYWMMPGLRFGCQYSTYPGDPLRFHSHFLATSLEWEEEFDVLDIVGGGRLGTGVKKGYLLGGAEPNEDATGEEAEGKSNVRTFCIEWAAM